MNPNHSIEEALRRALTARAEEVPTAPDALGTIRARIARRRLPVVGTRRNLLVTLITAVVVALGGGGVAVATAGGWPIDRHHPTPTPTGTAEHRVAVYYLGPVSLQDRLFREFHLESGATPAPAEAVRLGVQQMLDRPADDPDYHSPWPSAAAVRSVAIDSGAITVDLSGAGVPLGGPVDQVTEQMAVQQLVWTATAAVPGSAGVRLLLDGQPATTLWGWPVPAGVLVRGPAVSVLAPIWIIDPQQGAVVGHQVDVNLAGVSEAALWLRVRDGSSTVYDRQLEPLGGGTPAQGTAHLTLTLPSGRYTIEAYVRDTADPDHEVLEDHQFAVP